MVARVSVRLHFRASRRVPVDVQVMIAPGKAGIQHRRPARQGGGRKPRAGAGGAACLRPVAAAQAGHRQSRAGRPAQGRQPLRPADRARPDGGARRHSGRCARRLCRARRTRRSTARSPPSPACCRPRSAPMRIGKGLICPADCGPEAAWAGEDIDILAPRSLIAHRQSFPRHAGAVAARAGHPQAAARQPARPCRHQGPGNAPSGRSKSPPPAATTC